MTGSHPSCAARWAQAARALVLGASLGLLTAAPAHADLFADDQARRAILDLRAQQQQTSDSLQQIRNALLDLSNQIEQLKADLAQLRGQQDSGNRQLDQNLTQLQNAQKDLSQRVAALEPVSVQVGAQTLTVTPAQKAAFDHALATLRNADFANAAAQFSALLQQDPATPYAPEARYWLGNALFGAQQYKPAAAAFESLLHDAPQGPRAPEAMLGLANCQLELKQPKAARLTLHRLIKAYPKSDAATSAHDRLTKLQ